MAPVAYLRKSRVTSDRHVSWEVQERDIRTLAERHGDAESLVYLSDWGRSGRNAKRPGYQDLLQRLGAGQVSVIYGYSLSRLSRSLTDYAALAERCAERGVPIRLAKEGELRYDTAAGRLHVGMLALFAQMELELAQERARDTIAYRRERGDHVGGTGVPFDVATRVISAYLEAGSYSGAAKLMNESGIPTHRGGRWQPSVIHNVMRRHRPDLMPTYAQRRAGARSRGNYLFYRLLLCPCGQLLQGLHRGNGAIYYRCKSTHLPGAHIRRSILERDVLPWMQGEMARLRLPTGVRSGDPSDRTPMEERRLRVLDNYEDGLIDKAARDTKLRAIDAELERQDSAGRILRSGPFAWTAPVPVVNAALRSLLVVVQLDAHLLPVSATWTVPEFRATDP